MWAGHILFELCLMFFIRFLCSAYSALSAQQFGKHMLNFLISIKNFFIFIFLRANRSRFKKFNSKTYQSKWMPSLGFECRVRCRMADSCMPYMKYITDNGRFSILKSLKSQKNCEPNAMIFVNMHNAQNRPNVLNTERAGHNRESFLRLLFCDVCVQCAVCRVFCFFFGNVYVETGHWALEVSYF